MSLNIIILAAGQGTRMKSPLPKVLHPLGGMPILKHVIKTAQKLAPKNIFIVVGHESEKIKKYFADYPIAWIEQEKQLGTAHAVMQVLPHLKNSEDKVLILYGDVPLISSETLQSLISQTNAHQLGLITAVFENPMSLGRIVREKNKIIKIIEEKDADEKQKNIKEINSGIYIASVKNLQDWLPKITQNNNQKEYYLTDIVSEKADCVSITVQDNSEVQGVNDLEQLYQLECAHQAELAKKFRLAGVMVSHNVIFEGNVEIGSGSKIGPNCVIKDTKIGKNVEIKPNCVIEEAAIDDDCKVGPFARIRPGSKLLKGAVVGNFVEIKNSQIGEGSKVPHLSYVGDTEMGKHVNFGAGSITCNYDGVKKHKTVIEDNVFIGSNSQLIAPVTIEKGATIGAGSTITKTAPANKLTLARAKQQTVEGWKREEK